MLQIRDGAVARERPPMVAGQLAGLQGDRDDLALVAQAVDRPAAQRPVKPRIGAHVDPGVKLQLEIDLVGERAAALEALLQELLQALDDALGLRSARWQKCQPTLSAPQNG